MSRVVELHEGLSRDPAYALEFAKLAEDVAVLKALVRDHASKDAGEAGSPARSVRKGGAAPAQPLRARSA